MKTIDQRAKEFVQAPCTFKCDICPHRDLGTGCNWKHDAEVFSLGAKSEHEELTKWNSPKEPPQDDRSVLMKIWVPSTNIIRYQVGHYENKWVGFLIGLDRIIGWREIHE